MAKVSNFHQASAESTKPATAENLEERAAAYGFLGDPDLSEIREALDDLAAFEPVVFRTGRPPFLNEGVLAYFERAGNKLLGAIDRFRIAEEVFRSRSA